MPAKIRQRTFSNNIVNTAGASVTPATAVSKVEHHAWRLRRERLRLDAATIADVSTDDFGSTKICDLPNTNMLFLGAVITLTFTCAGFASNNGTSATFGVGTAAASNTSLTSTMVNLIPSTAGTGTATGSLAAASTATLFIAAGASNSLYLNLSDAVTTSTATLTISVGYIDIHYLDLGT